MELIKRLFKKIFIDGLSGMATGLFTTLIVGTILTQVGSLIPGGLGSGLTVIGKVASALTGAGIGVGVAYKFKESPMVILSAAAAGMVGAFASKIIEGSVYVDGVIHFSGPGEPLGAFLAALAAIGIGHLVSGKTSLDILLTPICGIVSGSVVGLLVGPPISSFMNYLGSLIEWGTQQAPFLMGIIVSVLMGMILTLPISSAALGVKKPVIWLPVILTSAILGPVATSDFVHMTNNATGSGMGTAGLVGQFTTYATMVGEGVDPIVVLIKMALLHFILPAVLTLIFSEFMRKKGRISFGDMKLDI